MHDDESPEPGKFYKEKGGPLQISFIYIYIFILTTNLLFLFWYHSQRRTRWQKVQPRARWGWFTERYTNSKGINVFFIITISYSRWLPVLYRLLGRLGAVTVLYLNQLRRGPVSRIKLNSWISWLTRNLVNTRKVAWDPQLLINMYKCSQIQVVKPLANTLKLLPKFPCFLQVTRRRLADLPVPK